MEMYSQEDLQSMREQMGVKTDFDENEHQLNSEHQENYDDAFQTKLGFLEILKVLVNELWEKIKRFFSYISYKKEL